MPPSTISSTCETTATAAITMASPYRPGRRISRMPATPRMIPIPMTMSQGLSRMPFQPSAAPR